MIYKSLITYLFLCLTYCAQASVTITEVRHTNEVCDLDNGTITIIAQSTSPIIYYSIDGGDTYYTSNFFEGLDGTDYIVTASDGLFCTQNYSVQIISEVVPDLDYTVDCLTGEGIVDVDLQPFARGVLPFTYSWIGPAGTYTTEDLLGVPTGSYAVTVTDDIGCSSNTSFEVSECCYFEIACTSDTSYYNCFSDYTEVSTADFQNLTTTVEVEESLLDLFSIQIEGNPCNVLTVDVTNVETASPDCDGDMIILTTIEISDGISTVSCTRTAIIKNYLGIQIASEAADLIVTCNEDYAVLFQEFLASYGGAIFSACTDQFTVTTFPVIPAVSFICGESTTEPITFVIEDECGNTASTSAEFIVMDDSSPTLTCPSETSIELNETTSTNIDYWLKTVKATDNCSALTLTNDYDDSYDLSKILCSEEFNVAFVAVDDCNNTASCQSVLSLYLDKEMVLECPSEFSITCSELSPDSIDYQILREIKIESEVPYDIVYEYELDAENIDCNDYFYFATTVEVIDSCGNALDCFIDLEVTPEPQVYIPNVFSPRVRSQGNLTVYANFLVEEVEGFMIYNKWGDLVHEAYDFEPNDEAYGWNGTYGSSDTSVSVFVYHAICRTITGEIYTYTGDVTLLE